MKSRYLVAFAAVILIGCGGSGGENPAPAGAQTVAAPAQFQGAYEGKNSAGKTVDVLILEDGSWWNIYGVPSGAALLVQGIAIGKATVTADVGNFYVGFTDFYAPGTSPIVGNGSGTYTGTTLNGMLTEGATGV
jgi:hypothetical protein